MGCIREQVNSQFLNFMFWKGHGPNSMEARFRYWIKTKKVIATFNLTIQTFFTELWDINSQLREFCDFFVRKKVRIASLYLTKLNFEKKKKTDMFSELQEYISQFLTFFPHNSDFFFRIVRYKVAILRNKVAILRNKVRTIYIKTIYIKYI